MSLPKVLVIDDQFGRLIADRRNLCFNFGLVDITGDDSKPEKVKDPVAEAIFCSGQRVEKNQVTNDTAIALSAIKDGWPHQDGWLWAMVLLDIRFVSGKIGKDKEPEGQPGDSDFGMRILDEIQKYYPDLPVVMLSSRERKEVSLEFSIKGAQAFIPRADEKGPGFLKEYLHKYGLLPDEEGEIVGCSKALLTALNSIRRTAFAGDRRNILIRGERGTGKELIAGFIHRQRARGKASPFVVVDSSNLTDELFASLLFGIEPKVATDVAARTGRIKDADGGELFFDEIKDMLPQVQAGVLRVLQEKEITPVGAKKPIPVDVSFISATNINIEALSGIGSFRPDLLDRLREGGTIFLPPLRERIEDIPLLVEKFVRTAEKSIPKAKHRKIEPEALEKLMRYDWPGNIRDLENCIKNAVMQYPDVEHLVPLHIRFPEGEKIGDKSIYSSSITVHPREISEEYMQTPLSAASNTFEEKKLPVMLTEQSRGIVNYILQALEIYRDKSNDDPNYPQTWMAMTGDTKKRNSSEYQRFIGNYIFQLPDEDIVSLMKQSKVFEKAVLQCGSKIQSAKKRLTGIRRFFAEDKVN